MIAGPRTVVRSSRAPLSIATRPSTRESISSPSMALLEVVEDQPVRVEHVLHLAGVLPPAAHDVRVDAQPRVDQVLDRVGDLELAAPRRLDRPRGVEDRRREHVDADERQVGLRLLRLLDQAGDAPVAVELGHAVVLGVGHRRQQDQRVRAPPRGTARPGR